MYVGEETLDKSNGGSYAVEDAVKRGLDIVLAAAGLFATIPAWIVLPIAIKLEDGGPVFYRQTRIGKDCREFTVIKFRSMVEKRGDERLAQQDEPDDVLITTVGNLMRKTALDELPQLLNILKGDMSLVGPRALPPLEKCGKTGKPVRVTELPGFYERQKIKPGLTGPAQVRAPRHASHRQKFRFDLVYLENRNIWLDLKLILKSIWISLRGAWKKVGEQDVT